MNNMKIIEYINRLSLEIKKERKRQNMLGQEVAKMLGISGSRYSLIETSPPQTTSLLRFIQMINVLHINSSNMLKKVYYNQNLPEKEYILEYENIYDLNSTKLIESVFSQIKYERKKVGYSQRALADKISIHKRYMSDIESGKSINLSLYRLIEISEALGHPIYELVERAEKSLLEECRNNEV